MEKIKLNISDLLSIPNTELVKGNNQHFESVVIDSRKVVENSLFVAIKGEKFDGHDFVDSVIKAGAAGVVVEKNKAQLYNHLDAAIFAVEDTITSLGKIANVWRNKLNAKVISITGSNGKTSTKEYLSTILSTKYNVVKTESNNNNHIGVPLTILNANSDTDFLILEHGTNHYNEISYTAKIANPDLAVITNIGDSHLEYLNDRNGVLTEKYELCIETIKNNGVIFLNLDDTLLIQKAGDINKKVTYSFEKDADVKGKINGYDEKGRINLSVSFSNNTIDCNLPVYGLTSAKNVLAASAIANYVGLSNNELIKGISNLKSVKGRLQVHELSNVLVVDDTYNANPDSMKAALFMLSKITTQKTKIAILGDMFELGDNAKELHIEVAKAIKNSDLSKVFLLGSFTKYIYEELKSSKIECSYFTDREELASFISKVDVTNSVVLVKGSRGMKMEEFVKLLLEREI